jgi:chemotaxis response regulator CheB
MAATQAQPFWLVAIAASAGGLTPFQKILSELPAGIPAAAVNGS